MTTYATSQRARAVSATDDLESAIAAAGNRGRHATADLTPILVRYWHEFPGRTAAQRRDLLDAIRARVGAGETTTRALVPIALGEPDEDIVFTATADYLGTPPVSVERRQAAAGEARDWIRRGVALNRGAVFAALLCAGDVAVNEELAGLRLLLTHAEVEVVCRRASARPLRATREFLADWLLLLDACDRPDAVARDRISRTLDGLAT